MTDSDGDDWIQWIVENFAPGQMIHLRPQLNIPGGWYEVVAFDAPMMRLRRKGSQVKISLEQCLTAWERPDDLDFAPGAGVLSLMGYSVAKDGPSVTERRRVLDLVYRLPRTRLPRVENWQEWGEAVSSERRSKIIRCLNAFAENASTRRHAHKDAVLAWIGDRDWFTRKFPDA